MEKPRPTPLTECGENINTSGISPALDSVVAAAAGRRTWAAWAGRESPNNTGSWQPGDELRGVLRLAKHRIWPSRKKPSECPVSYCEIQPAARIVLWCGCAVCEDCMRNWAASQLEDSAAAALVLKCPVCRATVRPEDAQRVMTSDSSLYRQYSHDLLSKALRADPDFVSCPKCDGGGFLGGPCMEQREQEREHAMIIQGKIACSAAAVIATVSTFKACQCRTSFVQGWLVSAAVSGIVHFLRHACFQKILAKTRLVQCPECQASFVLGDQGNKGAECTLSEQWIQDNCRDCPGCKAPITKNGGCNHMKCESCKVQFCWACMKIGKKCGAYKCHNGAPFGNASILGQPRQFPSRQNRMVKALMYLAILNLCCAASETMADRLSGVIGLGSMDGFGKTLVGFALIFFALMIIVLCVAVSLYLFYARHRAPILAQR